MNKIIVWILSHTNLIRNAAVAIAGALVGAGILDEKSVEQVAAGLVIVLTGLLNWVIEQHKAKIVKSVQAELNQSTSVKIDGYLGPVTKDAIMSQIRS